MENRFIAETSARHVHLTAEAVRILYGEQAELTVRKPLSQPGEFVSTNEKLRLIGPKGELTASVLGPVRQRVQVEVSFTDARALGLKDVPVRVSGDLDGTPGMTLVGPAGELTIQEGVIVAKRHLHATPADAEALGIRQGETVRVLIRSARTLVFDDVVVRVSPNAATAFHMDTDECNACAAFGAVYGELVR